MESRGIDSHVGRYDGQNAILVFDEVFGLGLTANETSESIEKLKERRADSKRLRFGEEVWQIQGRFASFSLSHLEARLRVHWPFLNVAELHVPYERQAGYLSVTVIYRSADDLPTVRRVLRSILWKKGPPAEERTVSSWHHYASELTFSSPLSAGLFALLTILVGYRIVARPRKRESP
jgi:hypothetical protein